ncbi:CvpA family protein [Staphylococcus americanisciuri]|uniref:CvpA family protein n=1 Tax=Staphylococcus americanisciuri TaxID=2973940 RepID=A0ABT2F2S6_9STAP|nr:CvpA family protein [Staphylococcus americanisciuri]MCS4486758.1 CvpA family protein [Staphylococcus americanisciuri]
MFALGVGVVVFVFMMVGFHRGLLTSVLHLSSTLFGLWIAKQFYQPFSDYLRLFLPFPKTLAYDVHYVLSLNQPEIRFDRICGFIFIVLIVKTLMYLVLNSLAPLFVSRRRDVITRLLGALVSVVSAIVVLHLASYVAVLIPDVQLQTHIAQSCIGQWLVFNVPLLSEVTLNL